MSVHDKGIGTIVIAPGSIGIIENLSCLYSDVSFACGADLMIWLDSSTLIWWLPSVTQCVQQ